MLRPSAAPRWKMTTRRLFCVAGDSTAPKAARVEKCWNGGGADDGECAVAKKYASSDGLT